MSNREFHEEQGIGDRIANAPKWTKGLPAGIGEGTRVLVMVTSAFAPDDTRNRHVRLGYMCPGYHVWMFDSGQEIEKLQYKVLGCTPLVYPPFDVKEGRSNG